MLGFDPCNTAIWDDESIMKTDDNKFNAYFIDYPIDALLPMKDEIGYILSTEISPTINSYMIFGSNNSPKNYGLTIVGYLYRYGFEKVDKFGFASAVGLVLLVGALIITLIQLRITGTIGKKED